jgi:glycerol-3-phosphate dehydrogenase (NAD(P)+)
VVSKPASATSHAALHDRTRDRGVNPLVYWLVRALVQPVFHLYFRLSRIGREHVPESGPVIYCSNHRSFLDPFVIGTIARRPLYYVAKQELFRHRFVAWLLNSLGAFPVNRGAGDQDMLATAKAILERGDSVLMFAEGTRIRPGALGRPKRGVGRLALETGAPVVPVAVIGTEAVRKGWRIRPHKVRIRIGSPLTFPRVEQPSPQLAAAVTDRIWPNVMLQWEWLGGLPPLRRAAVIGDGAAGTSLARMLTRAGLDVELHAAGDLELSRHDLVCFAVPAAELPAAVAKHGAHIPRRAGVLVATNGVVAPLGTLPGAYVAERTESWAVGVLGGTHASLVFATKDAAFRRQVTDALTAGGFDAAPSADVIGVELAGCAAHAAALAASTAAHAGPDVSGSAAGKVFAEVAAYARAAGAEPDTFAGVAGAGDLVATVTAARSATRREAELLVPLLAERAHEAGSGAPVLRGLANVIEGRVAPERWSASVTAPRPAAVREKMRAA